MPQVTYITANGTIRTHELRNGQSVMEGAIRNGVPGILAECGGACMCATCHVYVESEFRDIAGEISNDESDLLDTSSHRTVASRLSCQIAFGPALDGLRVTIAPED